MQIKKQPIQNGIARKFGILVGSLGLGFLTFMHSAQAFTVFEVHPKTHFECVCNQPQKKSPIYPTAVAAKAWCQSQCSRGDLEKIGVWIRGI